MKTNTKRILGLILVLVAITGLFVGGSALYKYLAGRYQPDVIPDTPQADATEAPQRMQVPDFTAVDRDGNEVRLSECFGTPIILNFWTSWCGPCQMEMPHFEEAYKEHTDIRFLMVNVTLSDTRAAAVSCIEDGGYTFPVLFDVRGEAQTAYSIQSFPTTFFIDSEGYLVTYAIGSLTEENLGKGIQMLKGQ